ECKRDQPLGMISGKIQDWQISASSTFPREWDPHCALRFARLFQDGDQCWCSKFKSSSEWLQIDMGLPTKVRLGRGFV
ncbi:hypothetical protein HELRODRAFT_84471, partial [Helobdella robusta]|uniref:F5/8 type C domain-containing protein n=1 Tax=Helobdella robusta TaxID=6412 RepID=T1G5J1_HELRO